MEKDIALKTTHFLFAASLLVLAACSSGDSQSADSAPDGTDGGGPASPTAPAEPASARTMPLDITDVHPGGVTITLRSVEVKDTETILSLTIANENDNERILNRSNGDNDYIFGADGSKLPLSPPANNPKLEIPPGQSVEADLAFSGRLDTSGPAALILNKGSNAENKYTQYPGFRIPIPLDPAQFDTAKSSRTGSSLRLVPSAAASASTESRIASVSDIRDELQARDTDRGTVVSLPGDVLFDFDKAEIRTSARPTLDKLAKLIDADPSTTIAIEGHTDSKGDDAYNKRLSERRAQAVRDYLKDVRGVAGDRMTTKGLGEDRPVAQNVTPEGRDNAEGMQKNRRVEVIIGKG